MNSEQIRAAVADMLKQAHVTYTARYIGEMEKDDWGADGRPWKCDAWRVSFILGAAASGARLPGYDGAKFPRMDTDFFTGIGLRTKPKTKYDAARPKAPTAADVLHSLVLDASAAHMSFRDWCADYGYDNDSIKALSTYNACCEQAQKLAAVFTRDQINTLRDLLADY